ncbi:Zn-dependent exopeptidase M28, partial [Escherichia coli]
TLDAEWATGEVPQITAILPGESDEVMIVDTHTDGQNFVEENGCITLLHLARYFASLPQREWLRRSVVFAGWPGHMTGEMPEAPGWALAHPELMKRAAAAFTIEHLGSSEWLDIPGKGYGPTGHNEYMNCPTTAGPLTDLVIEGIKRHDLLRHGVEPGPGVTTGVVFHESGVPHMALIGGPSYLLSIARNGHMDKLDAGLAAR